MNDLGIDAEAAFGGESFAGELEENPLIHSL
jgi:hypothetical protein